MKSVARAKWFVGTRHLSVVLSVSLGITRCRTNCQSLQTQLPADLVEYWVQSGYVLNLTRNISGWCGEAGCEDSGVVCVGGVRAGGGADVMEGW